MSVKRKRYMVICPSCGKAREVGYRNHLLIIKNSVKTCISCSRKRDRLINLCECCGTPIRKTSLCCRSCSIKKARQNRREITPLYQGVTEIVCGGCDEIRTVSMKWLRRVYRRGKPVFCISCSKIQSDTRLNRVRKIIKQEKVQEKRIQRELELDLKRGLYPLPKASRKLSFDLDQAIQEFKKKGGTVTKCDKGPIIKEPLFIKKAPLSGVGYVYNNGVVELVPVAEE